MVAEEEGVLEKAEGTKIDWKTGKDVTVKIMKKKPKKGGKDAKPQIKTEKIESFFNFFSPPDVRGALLVCICVCSSSMHDLPLNSMYLFNYSPQLI